MSKNYSVYIIVNDFLINFDKETNFSWCTRTNYYRVVGLSLFFYSKVRWITFSFSFSFFFFDFFDFVNIKDAEN